MESTCPPPSCRLGEAAARSFWGGQPGGILELRSGRMLRCGGSSPWWWESCMGTWLSPPVLEPACACRLWGAFPLSLCFPGTPKHSPWCRSHCQTEVCEAARCLCYLGGLWVSDLHAQPCFSSCLTSTWKFVCLHVAEPAVAFCSALQDRPSEGCPPSRCTQWCGSVSVLLSFLSPSFILLVGKCQNIVPELDRSSIQN